jgi:hypothetical protein
VNPADPNLPLLESVAQALGPLCDRFVFVGGCATGLLVTDRAASPGKTRRRFDISRRICEGAMSDPEARTVAARDS